MRSFVDEFLVAELDIGRFKVPRRKVHNRDLVFGTRWHDKEGLAVSLHKGKVLGDAFRLVSGAVEVQLEINKELGRRASRAGLENSNGLASVPAQENNVLCEDSIVEEQKEWLVVGSSDEPHIR